MKAYTIQRYYTPKGTYGELLREDGKPWLVTVERPHQRFGGDHPCVSEGLWYAELYESPTKGIVWLLNIPGRTWIEFHIANFPHELLGCIAPGMRYGCDPLTNSWGVFDSGDAFKAFMDETRMEKRIAFNIIRANLEKA